MSRPARRSDGVIIYAARTPIAKSRPAASRKTACIISRFVYIILTIVFDAYEAGRGEARPAQRDAGGETLKNLPLLSADFKRDYVATLAIVLFFLIVVAEITLAIAIPAYLYRENAMALEVRRLKLLESFDSARNRCNRIKPKNTAASMELQLVSWNLDRLAVYMRGESKHLTGDEISRIQEAINNSHGVLSVIESGKSLSQEAELKTDIYIDSLIPKKGEK